jgi:thiamine kinase-like enzyme
MTLTLDEAIARIPHWKGAGDLRATPLGGGITNNNFRVDVGGESFVLRIAGADTDLLGINREHEYAANLLAGKSGVAPEVYYFIRPEGYLVTRFIHGRPIPPEEITQPDNIRRVIDLVQKIHSMPVIPGSFDAFRVVQEYTRIAQSFHVAFPQDFDWLNLHLQEAAQALAVHPFNLCPCHNDLLNANFLSNNRLYILDWEYAGMGDAFFDLANFSDHHDLSDDQDRWMLACYFNGAVKPRDWAHLKIMKIISDLREATWGLVQIGISKLDFDFQAYADKYFGRVMNNIHNPHWDEYLKEVNQNV